MDENEIYELGMRLKSKHEELESKELFLKHENLELKKNLLSLYGYIRIMDHLCDEAIDMPEEVKVLISVVRTFSSSACEDLIN